MLSRVVWTWRLSALGLPLLLALTVGATAAWAQLPIPVQAAVPVGVLSDSGAVPAAVSTDSARPSLWDIEVEAHASRARVTYFVNVFSGRVKEAFEKGLSRQTRYAGLISDRLRASGLPQDLTYLAFIESWYNPDAYSKAAAVGMWQFMARTAKGVGLRVDWWVDERRDPIRSTEGAVRLLSSLHDEFGSLFLAAAAYNGGSGRVSRGMTQFARRVDAVEGEDKFFALSETRYLRPETRDYVPKIIAAALVAKQPERYGLVVDSLPTFAFDSVHVAGGVPLAAIALGAAVPVDSIAELNTHILRGLTPPGDSMWVRVPAGMADGFAERFSALDSAELVGLTSVRSKSGESITSIARKHKLTAKQLNWYNPKATRLKSGNLVAGQTIMVPTRAAVSAARDVPNPSIERYPRRSRSRPPVRPATRAAASAPARAPVKSPVKAPAKAATKR
ncbi:MAG: transglycosylase SLT domain-containing protein [Gemmatimonadota bacterium]|nr:transglycosylase SLT domain-containing protein [Gemmatimonadota bacterium]